MTRLVSFFHVFLLIALLMQGHCADEAQREQYQQWHKECLSADKHGIDQRIAHFEAALAKDGGDALARAYLGSAHALRAKESFWGTTKQKHLKLAEQEMNQAVADAPEDARVRMIRAVAAYKVPKRFGKRAQALEDFGQIIPLAREGRGDLTLRERQVILYYAALCYQEEGHAGHEELRKLSHELDPESEIGKLAAP